MCTSLSWAAGSQGALWKRTTASGNCQPDLDTDQEYQDHAEEGEL